MNEKKRFPSLHQKTPHSFLTESRVDDDIRLKENPRVGVKLAEFVVVVILAFRQHRNSQRRRDFERLDFDGTEERKVLVDSVGTAFTA